MFDKNLESKKLAIKLRKEGLTYSEILKKVTVAKSTLSLWLNSVNLSKKQKQRVTSKKIEASKKGGLVRKTERINKTEEIKSKSKSEIKSIKPKELFLIGVALYWAEGSKQKKHNVSQGVRFANSDPSMVKLFLAWLNQIGVSNAQVKYELYIHDTADYRKAVDFWSRELKCKPTDLKSIYFKKGSLIPSSRMNRGADYHGLIRVSVGKSTDLNRRIDGWVEGIIEKCGIV